ncbi:hypothetical protein [Anoxynatronum sibiricum]|uniref:TRASH domain-containing protein n=1 Tax=Anoxynatronum sibiricum TaxID=210623 RepID=A0ABU9VPI4_9CLOT
MDTFIYSVLRITVMVLIFRTILRFFSYRNTAAFQVTRKKGLARTDTPVEELPDKKENAVPVEMVMDTTCNCEIPRKQAYILLDDQDQPVYFCSWECRAKYLATRVSA